MSLIRSLYTHLISNRKREVEGWHKRYVEFTKSVNVVRDALRSGHDIQNNTTYEGTTFEKEADAWGAFARHLIYEKSNGISSRGQSVLREAHFSKFIKDPAFVSVLAELITAPTKANFDTFKAAWEKARQQYGADRNPLLINRTLAACTTEVSTTVDAGDFNFVYNWMKREGDFQPNDAKTDWYEQNVEVVKFLRDLFTDDLTNGVTDNHYLNMFVWYLFGYISNPFTIKKQVVKYGAPGTGKTYAAKQNAQQVFDIWAAKYENFEPRPSYDQCVKVVQFHPSYGYEDFIEGLRPILTADGQPQLKLQNGVFKEFCKQAGT